MERMDLGKGKLLRTGLNSLYQAIHPTHGLAWTDGNQIVLTDLQLHSGEAKFGDSEVIGQFEQVCGLSWAPSSTASMPALLAVQHKKHIVVWQLCPSTLGSSKWQISQVSEIRESLPVLNQGCVWHPKSTVLSVFTAQYVSIFPDVHCNSFQVKVDINTKGQIYCACWTLDGQRLVVAIDSSLHSYIWDSAQKTLHKCSFCPVFDVYCSIRSITATVDSQVAIATELPLDKICSLNPSETFGVPPRGEDAGVHTLPVIGSIPSKDEPVPSPEINSGLTVSPSFSDPLDLSHIHFNQSKAEESPLICQREKYYLTGTGQGSSHLVLVTFEKSITKTRKFAIPGILVPDLIASNLKAHLVAVASNTCNIILIYHAIPSSMPKIQQIQLESTKRPKGMHFLTDRLLLISVGKQKFIETAFLPSSESDQYTIRLIVKEVILGQESSIIYTESQSASSKTLHSPSSFWTTLLRPSKTSDHTSTPDPSLSQRENSQKEKETSHLSKELDILSRNLIEMQQYLFDLMDFLHNEKRFSPGYPLSQDPPYVHLIYQVTSPRRFHYSWKFLHPWDTAKHTDEAEVLNPVSLTWEFCGAGQLIYICIFSWMVAYKPD